MSLEIQFRLYSILHFFAKKILKKGNLPSNYNIIRYKIGHLGVRPEFINQYWESFIRNSKISDSSQFSGFHYAGYILEKDDWILPSWIWTNAAIVRVLLSLGKTDAAISLGKLLISKQEKCGGWVVRHDYDKKGQVPVLAPNDSAYIANNAFLSLYCYTKELTYLNVAEKCAQWIIESSRDDCLVYTGYNLRDKAWLDNVVIVDVGFTAGLFANLYTITKKNEYLIFLKKFIYRYIDLFFNYKFSAFATSIDKENKQQGGYFGRGQAWALEGLIPAYKVLKDPKLEWIIDSTIDRLIKLQNSDGSWSYNLSRKMMGNDCKGVSVIAKSLANWYEIKQLPTVYRSIEKAFKWCSKHTKSSGKGRGGIFSFSTEGAIVKDLYSSCAFVYASAYALEIDRFLSTTNENNNLNPKIR